MRSDTSNDSTFAGTVGNNAMSAMRSLREFAFERWLFFGTCVVLALVLRLALFPFESGDFTQFTRGWYEAIDTGGVVAFLASSATNYAPLYLYGMVLAQALFGWLPAVMAIKMIALPFDFVCAFYVARVVGLRWSSPAVGRLAFAAALFLPTVVINGSMWGQADVLYTTGIVAFVYYMAVARERAACIALGLAFAVKLQALFIAPLVLVLLLARRMPLRETLWIPGIYVASVIPAWLAGRPLGELLGIYLRQAAYYPRLTSNAPHLYQWLPSDLYGMLLPAGLVWAAAVVLMFVYALYRMRPAWDATRLVEVGTIVLILVPFCTPKMHERYFFPADVMALALAFHRPQLAIVPVAVGTISFFSYAPFLMKMVIVPLPLLALAMGGVLLGLLYRLGAGLAAERCEREGAKCS